MPLRMRDPRDRNAYQSARSDFIVDTFRNHLAPGSLWHEKRFALGQLESLVIASTGGIYYINTFDRFDPQLAARPTMTVLGDLGIEVAHDSLTHEALTPGDIERIIVAANSTFEILVSNEGAAIISGFRRVTCNIEFASPDDDTERYAALLFGEIAKVFDYPITIRRFVPREIFLPPGDPTLPDMQLNRDFARSAAEFVFENRLPVKVAIERFQRLLNDCGSLRELNITANSASRHEANRLECVGRYF